MVTYGPWTQDPDYTASVGAATGTATNTATYVEALDPSTNLPPADPSQLAAVANASGTSGYVATRPQIGSSNVAAPLKGSYDFQGGGVGNDGTLYRAGRNQPLWPFSAWVNGTNSYRGVAGFPPGATGIEWEGGQRVSTVLGASISYYIANVNIDDSNGDAPCSGGSWSTNVTAYTNAQFDPANRDTLLAWDGATDRVGGTVLATFGVGGGGSDNTYTAQPAVDVSALIYGDPEDGYLALSVDFDLGATPVMASYSADQKGFHVGAMIAGPTITYTLRPPMYRFIYPDSTPPATALKRAAPLRIVQRGNDGLGMTGGRRIVQARTIQSTNRRGPTIR